MMDLKYLYKKELEVPLYRGKLVILLTNDKEQLQKHLPEFNNERIYAHSWITNFGGYRSYVIILNFNNKLRKIYNGAITHETIHIANFIAQARGLQPDFINDEPIAYLTEWVADEVYRFMNEHNFKAYIN